MKGEFSLTILEKLARAAADAGDLCAAILEAGYGASYNKIEYGQRKIQQRRLSILREKEKRLALQRRYYNLMAWLKKDGLVAEYNEAGKKLFRLTNKGSARYELLKKRQKCSLPIRHYTPQKINNFIIMAYDIPENQRIKRDWLRSVLKNLGFTMVQKSLWLGKIKIPREFINDLSSSGLLEAVEIFEINKKGSLHKISLEN